MSAEGSPPTTPPVPHPMSPAMAISSSRPCRQCGYDLRSLATDGACPECGSPIRNSLRGFLLEFASPDYLRSLRLGATVIEASKLASFVGGFLVFLGGIALAVYKIINGQALTAFSGLDAANEFADIAFMLGSTVGMWWLTAPDPGATQDEDPRARRLIRAALVASLFAQALSTIAKRTPILAALGIPVTAAPTASYQNNPYAALNVLTSPGFLAISLIGLLHLAAYLTGYIATMIYFRSLAARLKDSTLDRWAKRMLWLGPVLYTVGAACVGLGPLAASIIYIFLIDRIRARLRALERSAAANPQ